MCQVFFGGRSGVFFFGIDQEGEELDDQTTSIILKINKFGKEEKGIQPDLGTVQ